MESIAEQRQSFDSIIYFLEKPHMPTRFDISGKIPQQGESGKQIYLTIKNRMRLWPGRIL
jgi:hypothetical protein